MLEQSIFRTVDKHISDSGISTEGQPCQGSSDYLVSAGMFKKQMHMKFPAQHSSRSVFCENQTIPRALDEKFQHRTHRIAALRCWRSFVAFQLFVWIEPLQDEKKPFFFSNHGNLDPPNTEANRNKSCMTCMSMTPLDFLVLQ